MDNKLYASPIPLRPHEAGEIRHLPHQHSHGDDRAAQNVHSCYDADNPTKHLLAHVATTAFDSDQEGDAPKCHPNTRKAVLDEITNWIIATTMRLSWMLWLNGAAGAGKSAIARSIVEICLQRNIPLARFFFFRTDSSRNTITSLVPSLVYQLIQCLPDLEALVIPKIQSDPLIFTKSLNTQFQYLIFEPLLDLQCASETMQTVVLVLDGLDECSGDINQTNIIRIIAHFVQEKSFPLIAFFGSRAEPQLKEAFRAPQISKSLLQLPLDDHYLPDDDIQLFLNDNFSMIKATHVCSHLLSPDWPSEQAVQQIVEKSSGQFIYASVVVKFISASRAHPAQQLDIIVGLRHVGRATPFAQLDALYHHIFSQVQNINHTLPLLAARILCNYQGLSGCGSMAGIPRGEEGVALMDLYSVVEVTSMQDGAMFPLHTPGIKFLHASLPDFLLDGNRSRQYCVDTPNLKSRLCDYILKQENGDERMYIGQYTDYLISLLPGAECTPELRRTVLDFRPTHKNIDFWKAYYLPMLEKMDFEDNGEAYFQQAAVIEAIEKSMRPPKRSVKALLRSMFKM